MIEAAGLAGCAESTARKYAPVLKIEYFGTGRRKVYNWKQADIPRLKEIIGKQGRPPKAKKPPVKAKPNRAKTPTISV
jgi:hypothetical protein